MQVISPLMPWRQEPLLVPFVAISSYKHRIHDLNEVSTHAPFYLQVDYYGYGYRDRAYGHPYGFGRHNWI